MKTSHRKLLAYIISVFYVLVVVVGYSSLQPDLKYIALLFNTLLFGGWLVYRIRSKRPYHISKTVIPIIFFLVLQAILIPLTPFPYTGVERVLLNLIIIIGFVFVQDTLGDIWEIGTWENALLNIALVFTLIELALVVMWYSNWFEISGSISQPPVGYRISGLFLGHANVTAGFINLVLPIALVRLIISRTRSRRTLWAIALLLFFAIEYFASSRGGWLGALAGIATTLGLIGIPKIKSEYKRLLSSIRGRPAIHYLVGGSALIALCLGLVYAFVNQAQTTPGHAPIASARSGIWGPAWSIFTSSPLWGHGPGSFSVHYAAETQIPPGFATSHAHNILLQIGTEMGIMGLAVVLWIAVTILRNFLKTWCTCTPAQRIRLAAYTGAGVSLGIHHGVDYLLESPLYAIGILIIVALTLHHAPDSEKLILQERRGVMFLSPLLIIYVLGTLYTSRGSATYWDGVNAGRQGRWEEASERICQAVEINPSVTIHFFQCGLAKAYSSHLEDDPQALTDAISIIKLGLSTDPYWPVHWANLAALEWQAGNYDQALSDMRHAVETAPRNALFALNLGWMEEELNHPDQARIAYNYAIDMDRWLRYSQLFTSSMFNDDLIEDQDQSIIETPYADFIWSGWEALRLEKLDLAEDAFTRSINQNPLAAKAYAGLALIYQQRGQSEQAMMNARTALFIGGPSPDLFDIAGRVALQQGRLEEAMWYFDLSFKLIFDQSFSWQYYNRTYLRFFLAPDLVPWLRLAQISIDQADDYTLLAEHYEEAGQHDEAQEIFKVLTLKSND